jgi:hypothetical protein
LALGYRILGAFRRHQLELSSFFLGLLGEWDTAMKHGSVGFYSKDMDDYATLNCTHISLPISLLMLVVRKASESVRGTVFYCLLLSCVSHYGHLADSVAPCAACPGLRGSSGWPLAAFNTRTGESFRRPIRCCRYRWRCGRALC